MSTAARSRDKQSLLRKALAGRSTDLGGRFERLEQKIAQEVLPFAQLPDFTNHGVRHARSVERRISLLLSDEGVAALTPFEIFVLLAAALLHDIGMAAKDAASESSVGIRLNHFGRSERIIIEHRNYFGFSTHEAKVIGLICRSHGTTTLDHVAGVVPSIEGYGVIRVALLCALLRIGDALDLTAARAPEVIAAWRVMYPANKIHWDIHARITDISIKATPIWEIAIHAMPENRVEECRLFELRNWLQAEIDTVSPFLRTCDLYYRKVDLTLQHIAREDSWRTLKNPFLELAPFGSREASRFAGREKEIAQLVQRVLGRKLTVVIGDSGVGKTSLVEGGLVPRLRQYRFGIIRFSFHADPVGSLLEAVQNFGRAQPPTDVNLHPSELVNAIDEAIKKRRNIDRFLIIGDHLEQMFTISKDEELLDSFARTFYRVLDNLCPGRASFLFCMRQDYLGKLYDLSLQVPELYERQNMFKLYRLSRQNGEEALKAASECARIKVAPALLERLLDDLCSLGNGGIDPPYLQIVGHRLYVAANKQLDGSADTIHEGFYQKLGGAERIASDYFASILDRYTQAEKPIVGQILAKMVTDYNTKKRVTKEELENVLPAHANLESLLASLVTHRIVRRSLGEYELIHDCLAEQVVQLVKKQTFLSPPVRKALKFMEKEYQKPNLRLDVIARAAGVTPIHLASLFREQLGRTVNRQLNTVRIGASKRMLAEDRRPIAEIAGQVGFRTLCAFSRKFSTLEQISPLQYRKKLMATNTRRAS